MRTYIKLYRKTIENDFLANDNNAYIVFTKILLRVNWQTGEMITGRYKLSRLVNLKPTTAYAALKRLEKHKMVTLMTGKMTNKYTKIKVLNWQKYQSDDNPDDNSMTIKRQSNDTINNNKIIKEVRKNNIVEVQRTYDLYLEVFNKNKNQYKLTDKRKQKLKARLNDCGEEMLRRAITNTSKSSFHTGDNDRGWTADLDFIIRSYEQVEKLANKPIDSNKLTIQDIKSEDLEYVI